MHREIEGRGENIEDLLKKLLELSSIEASLHFKLATKLDEARTEVIRLSGLLSMCELKEKNLNRYRAIVEEMINKYVMEIRGSQHQHI
jgi:hypothetical protein